MKFVQIWRGSFLVALWLCIVAAIVSGTRIHFNNRILTAAVAQRVITVLTRPGHGADRLGQLLLWGIGWDRVPSAEALVAFEFASREAIANGNTSGSDEATGLLAAAEAAGCGKPDEADASARAALKRATEANDLQSQACHRSVVDNDAAAQLLLAGLAAGTHSSIEAEERATAAKALFQKVGDQMGEAKSSYFQGWAIACKGKFEEGIESCTDAAIRFRQMGVKKLEALVCYGMARLFLSRCMPREASELAEDAVMGLRTLQPPQSMLQAYAADLLVQAFILKGDSRSALRVTKENLDHFKARAARHGNEMD
eukprot:symbB.v1.2.021711.t1/scaffold1892.1/size96974/8